MNASVQGWCLGWFFFPSSLSSLIIIKDQPQLFYWQIHVLHEAQHELMVPCFPQPPQQPVVNWSSPGVPGEELGQPWHHLPVWAPCSPRQEQCLWAQGVLCTAHPCHHLQRTIITYKLRLWRLTFIDWCYTVKASKWYASTCRSVVLKPFWSLSPLRLTVPKPISILLQVKILQANLHHVFFRFFELWMLMPILRLNAKFP